MDAHNGLNHMSCPLRQRESIANEECITTNHPLSRSQRTVGATESRPRRSALRWVVRHPGLQAAGVILATVSCFAVLPNWWFLATRRHAARTPRVDPLAGRLQPCEKTDPLSRVSRRWSPRRFRPPCFPRPRRPVLPSRHSNQEPSQSLRRFHPQLRNRIFRRNLIPLRNPEKDWRRKSIVSP